MKAYELRKQLNCILENLTGCRIGEQCIWTDRDRNFTSPRSLQRRKPLIIAYDFLVVVIPYQDWEDLLSGEIFVEDYVNGAIWNYGYYRKFSNLETGGVFWHPLEDGKPGINDKEKVKRYLTISNCRSYEETYKERPLKSRCRNCSIEKCPVSNLPSKKSDMSLREEFPERNVRHALFEAYKTILKERFALEVCALEMSEEFNVFSNSIFICEGYTKGTVKIFISEAMFIDMMYEPDDYCIRKIINTYSIFACTQRFEQNKKPFLLDRIMEITDTTERIELDEFWGKK